MKAHFQIVETAAEQPFHTRFVATNGEQIDRSSEDYVDERGAQRAIEIMAESFGYVVEGWGAWGVSLRHNQTGIRFDLAVDRVDERTSEPS